MDARLLGETDEEFELDRSETVRDAVLSLATQARRSGRIRAAASASPPKAPAVPTETC